MPDRTAADLRLLSWNVRSLRDGRSRVAEVIRAADVDVAAIQEAPRFVRWRSKRAALAREAGLVVGTADRVGGLVVLTSMRSWVLSSQHRTLPALGGRHRRAVVSALVSVAGFPPWRVTVGHLGLHPQERAEHARLVNAEARSGVELVASGAIRAAGGAAGDDPVAAVLAADVNDVPGSETWQAVSDGLLDCLEAGGASRPTYPAVDPRRRIDGIFAAAGVRVVAAEVLDLPAADPPSDHLPLVVTLRAPVRPPAR
jgi:endonuclease/exonuclease/phosphatase family metal-dependent hydrolase